MKNLIDLFINQLGERYAGEKQLIIASSIMVNVTHCAYLKQMIHNHIEQTALHVRKLERIFKALGEKPTAQNCLGIMGILKEGESLMSEYKDAPALDAALVSIAQKIIHYEIAAYGCLQEWATTLDQEDAALILSTILDEEHRANRLLIDLARNRSNQDALSGTTIYMTPDSNRPHPKGVPIAY